jgi:hypothetical protein
MFNINDKKCPQCGIENRSDARFCRQCGYQFSGDKGPIIDRHHWARRPQDFVVRIDADDMPGLLRHGLIVEPGTNAMLIIKGVNQGVMPPGEYALENVLQRFHDWATTGIPERATVLLVDVAPVDLEFHLGGRFTSDPLPIGITIRMRVEVAEPGKFLINVLKGKSSLSIDELRESLYYEVTQVADDWLRKHTLQQLVDEPKLRSELELAVEEVLRTVFIQSGLRFLQVRTVELNLEPYDQIKGVRGQLSLLKYRSAAETDLRKAQAQIDLDKAKEDHEIKKNYADLTQQQNLEELVEQTRKVELEERKVEVYQRMRQAATTDRMNEVRTVNDFDRFLDEQDRSKLLSEKEKAELLRTWKEEGEDHDRARAHLLARLEVEGNFELRVMELKQQQGFDIQKLDGEIEIVRKRSDAEYDMRRKTSEQELQLERDRMRIQQEKDAVEAQRKRLQMELGNDQRKMERQQDADDAELALSLLKRMKEIRREDDAAQRQLERLDDEERRRISRVDELERLKVHQQLELEKMEIQARERAADRAYEIQRIEALGKLGAEALIAVSGAEQAQIIVDLKRTEALKGMTEEQILAAAAEKSPEIARAFQEKFRAMADNKVSEREKELYERLLGDRDLTLHRTQEDADKRVREVNDANERAATRTQEITERALDRMSDTAQSFAKGSTLPPIIVTPGGIPGMVSPQVVFSGEPGSAGRPAAGSPKNCTKCGKQVAYDVKYCPHCGNKFEGME